MCGHFFFTTPCPGRVSISKTFVSVVVFCILSYLLLKRLGCVSCCLVSSANIQKLFCGICSAFKCSCVEFVGEKVVSPSYSSFILGPPPVFSFLFVFKQKTLALQNFYIWGEYANWKNLHLSHTNNT